MSISLYPPQIESHIMAFSRGINNNTTIIIPYELNKAVFFNDFTHMSLMIKTVTSGTIKWTGETSECKLYSNDLKSYYAIFSIDHATFDPVIGNHYKVQLAFKNNDNKSNWSTIGIVKCTQTPEVTIESLIDGIDNLNPTLFIGAYINQDVTEKLYSYNFIIYDENNEIYETSGELVHNSVADEIITGSGLKATFQWQPKKTLTEKQRYRIAVNIITINQFKKSSVLYIIKAAETVDARIPAKLLASPDYDNGCVHLSLTKIIGANVETPISGHFVISRYATDTNTWYEICRFNMLSQTPSELGIIWTDYTLEHGVKYLYSLQAYNSKQLYSSRMYHVLLNQNFYNKTPYLEYDEFGEPYPIIGDFEDMFLTDGERQLKIKYNPKVTSYKTTLLESKVDTLGGRFPFIFRNGNVNYKEFPISGLLSYLSDEKELFMTGINSDFIQTNRPFTPLSLDIAHKRQIKNIPEVGSRLTTDNFYQERTFKMAVLEWLNNGKPKLFRSPGEGNCIVRLMNTSLSPLDQLGRMLHSFSSTAYEIAECTFENLQKYNLLSQYKEENRTMKFVEVKLSEVSHNNVYAPGYDMYYVYITNASPNTQYILGFNNLIENSAVTYTIGITGALYMDVNTYPVASITKINGDINETAMLHYGYYDNSVPDNFSYVSQVTIKDEIVQIIGYDHTKNIITDKLEDIRREIGRFYNITIKPRPIISIYSFNEKFYRDELHINEISTGWMDTAIYYIVNENVYYSGQPRKILLGSTLPQQYFELNNLYIIDLYTGNAYMSTDSFANSLSHNPQAGQYFTQLTNGSYTVTCVFGKIHSLRMSTGVYIETSYELKEIEYTVESTDTNVIAAKRAWLSAKAIYENTLTEEDYAMMKVAYTNYITILSDALKEQNQMEGNYAL